MTIYSESRPGDDGKEMLERLHGGYVHKRRVEVLGALIADLLPRDARVLDVGCGDGGISSRIMAERPDVRIQGIDVKVRSAASIPVVPFDGKVIACGDGSFDVVMLIDVLHHTIDPMVILREAVRVARHQVVIKDHNLEGFLGEPTLHLMDWVGNARHGVALPHTYWTPSRWQVAFESLGLARNTQRTALRLYPPAIDWIFGRQLHFLVCLKKGPPAVADLQAARAA